MPDNHDEPTHSLMRETAREEPWLLRLIGKPATTRVAILPIGAYHDLLSPLGAQLGRAHVRTPVTNAPVVCRLPLENKNKLLPCRNKHGPLLNSRYYNTPNHQLDYTYG